MLRVPNRKVVKSNNLFIEVWRDLGEKGISLLTNVDNGIVV